jgi:hypothetical protein
MGAMVFQIDIPNTARLRQIVSPHGWPEPPKFSKATLNAAWYLAQHAMVITADGAAEWDAELAESILPGIRQSVTAGDLTPWHYAAMYDRTALRQGHQQRYATQIRCQDGQATFPNVEDMARINEFRAEIGTKAFDQASYDQYCAENES